MQREIEALIDEIGEPRGIDVQHPSRVAQRDIQRDYLPQALSCDERTKRRVLEEFRAAWRENEDNDNRRRFGRAMVNLAEYCLKPTEIGELSQADDIRHAIDAVARISRWYHTNPKCNLWRRFRPYARQAVELLWGDIQSW
ncbi:MAG: hypothetical protein WBL61_09500 [Bryobacteraceae bacterium]